MRTVLTSIVNPVYKIDFTDMACLDFFKNSSINAYNPNCNPEFLLCNGYEQQPSRTLRACTLTLLQGTANGHRRGS